MSQKIRPVISNSLVDRFLKKKLEWNIGHRQLRVEVPIDVFSSHAIDAGTELLVKSLARANRKWSKALDVGCGYGPIPAWLLASECSAAVDGIERDWLAAQYAIRNATKLSPGFRYLSGLAFDGVERNAYDLVVSNLPAKAGPSVHRLILLGASSYLRTDGQVWIVVVSPLQSEIETILAIKGVDIFQRTITHKHVVYGYSFSQTLAADEDAYFRSSNYFSNYGPSYQIDALHNVDEFDSYSFGTELLVQALRDFLETRQLTSLAVLNPTQGHLAIIPSLLQGGLEKITLLSRDALELKASHRNLISTGFSGSIKMCHGVELPKEPVDLVVGHLHEKEGMDLVLGRIEQMLSLPNGPTLMLSSKSGFHGLLVRQLQKLPCKPSRTIKGKGFSMTQLSARENHAVQKY